MPILQIKALPQEDSSKVAMALKATTLAISEAYGCSLSQVWATWEGIKPGHYVEGGSAASTQPMNTHPPIATLTCFEGKSAIEVEKVLTVASKTLCDALGLENNIFMTYVEAKSGQVIAGNGVLRR